MNSTEYWQSAAYTSPNAGFQPTAYSVRPSAAAAFGSDGNLSIIAFAPLLRQNSRDIVCRLLYTHTPERTPKASRRSLMRFTQNTVATRRRGRQPCNSIIRQAWCTECRSSTSETILALALFLDRETGILDRY